VVLPFYSCTSLTCTQWAWLRLNPLREIQTADPTCWQERHSGSRAVPTRIKQWGGRVRLGVPRAANSSFLGARVVGDLRPPFKTGSTSDCGT